MSADHSWLRLELYQFDDGVFWVPTLDTLRMYSALHGERSDGVHFFVAMNVGVGASAAEISLATANATAKMNTFRTCPCHAGFTCARHETWSDGRREEGEILPGREGN